MFLVSQSRLLPFMALGTFFFLEVAASLSFLFPWVEVYEIIRLFSDFADMLRFACYFVVRRVGVYHFF